MHQPLALADEKRMGLGDRQIVHRLGASDKRGVGDQGSGIRGRGLGIGNYTAMEPMIFILHTSYFIILHAPPCIQAAGVGAQQ
jgi:hypothetical protein